MFRANRTLAALTLAIGTLALAACESPAGSSPDTPNPTITTVDQPTAPTATSDLLTALTVAPEHPRDGYDRDLFPHWTTTDGCDTRQWVLIAESLTDGQIDHRCNIVSGGTWNSLYDGITGITDPSSLDIDHVVALAEAWDSGAHAWDTARRQAFANDLDHDYTLIAVTAASNRQKGDKDPAEWRPSNQDYWCQYATDWARVKIDWDLTVDQAEHDALADMLSTCPTTAPTQPTPGPETTVAVDTTVPEPTTTVAPTTTAPAPTTTIPADSAPVQECDPNYVPADGSCIPPRHLVGDLDCPDLRPEQKPIQVVGPHDPHRFDLDRNGIGCERT